MLGMQKPAYWFKLEAAWQGTRHSALALPSLILCTTLAFASWQTAQAAPETSAIRVIGSFENGPNMLLWVEHLVPDKTLDGKLLLNDEGKPALINKGIYAGFYWGNYKTGFQQLSLRSKRDKAANRGRIRQQYTLLAPLTDDRERTATFVITFKYTADDNAEFIGEGDVVVSCAGQALCLQSKQTNSPKVLQALTRTLLDKDLLHPLPATRRIEHIFHLASTARYPGESYLILESNRFAASALDTQYELTFWHGDRPMNAQLEFPELHSVQYSYATDIFLYKLSDGRVLQMNLSNHARTRARLLVPKRGRTSDVITLHEVYNRTVPEPEKLKTLLKKFDLSETAYTIPLLSTPCTLMENLAR